MGGIAAVFALMGSIVAAQPAIKIVNDLIEIDLRVLAEQAKSNSADVAGLSLKHLYAELTVLERQLHEDRRAGRAPDPYIVNRIRVINAKLLKAGG